MESCHVRLGDNLLLEESYPQGQDEEWITSQWGEGGDFLHRKAKGVKKNGLSTI